MRPSTRKGLGRHGGIFRESERERERVCVCAHSITAASSAVRSLLQRLALVGIGRRCLRRHFSASAIAPRQTSKAQRPALAPAPRARPYAMALICLMYDRGEEVGQYTMALHMRNRLMYDRGEASRLGLEVVSSAATARALPAGRGRPLRHGS